MLAALLPENAIVADESVTTGRNLAPHMARAAPHDWLSIMGGSIGWALPVATGAAIGAPERKVVALEGDGSGMYTLQALWTMARENLDVTVVLFANRVYQILRGELKNVGAGTPGPARQRHADARPARPRLERARPRPRRRSGRAETLEEFADQLRRAFSRRGPNLVVAALL